MSGQLAATLTLDSAVRKRTLGIQYHGRLLIGSFSIT